MTDTKLRAKIKTIFRKKQNFPSFTPVIMGDGQGNLEVPGMTNYIYVRVNNTVSQVLCNKVAPVYDAAAFMGIDPLQPSVTQIINGQASAVGGNGGDGTPPPISGIAPANRYRWFGPGGGGQDPLFVEARQIMPLRLGIVSGMTVGVYQGIVWNGSTYSVVYDSFSLSSYIPSASGYALFVLITIDNTGTVVKTAGSEVAIASLDLTYLPDPPAGTKYVIGAVRLYTGQTAIIESATNTDIVDLRFTMRHFHQSADITDLSGGGNVSQSGSVTPGNLATWSGDYTIVDGGPVPTPGGGGGYTQGASITLSGAINTTQSAGIDVAFDTAIFDTDGMFDVGTPGRITCITAGTYSIIANLALMMAETILVQLAQFDSVGGTIQTAAYHGSEQDIFIPMIWKISIGDYITVFFEDDTGDNEIYQSSNLTAQRIA